MSPALGRDVDKDEGQRPRGSNCNLPPFRGTRWAIRVPPEWSDSIDWSDVEDGHGRLDQRERQPGIML